jgi:hypothetical protein
MLNNTKITKLVKYFSFGISSIYFLYATIKSFLSPLGLGDENTFYKDLIYFKENGYYLSVQKGISIPYTVLNYFFDYFTKDELIAMRLSSLLILFILLLYLFIELKKIKKNIEFTVIFMLLFFVSTTGYFFFGTNDGLFFLGLIILGVETLKAILSLRPSMILFCLGLSIAISTRALVMVYFPFILLAFLVMFINNVKFNTLFLCFVIPLLFLCLINFPNFSSANFELSYDKKVPNDTSLTWPQRQYLSQLMVNEGKLPNNQRVSWEETKKYLELNGQISLPKSQLESLTFDLKLTITEFFKDFFQVVVVSTRSLGIIMLFCFYSIIVALYKKNFNLSQLFIPISLLLMVLVFSFIIISFVELRWLSAVFILSILYFNVYANNKLVNLQHFMIIILSAYFVIKNFIF